MRREAGFTRGRMVAVALVNILAGVQIGLYLADYYDDGVASALSLGIGIAILAAGIALAVMPFVNRNQGRHA